jgi:opacity protein-like surface antigen
MVIRANGYRLFCLAVLCAFALMFAVQAAAAVQPRWLVLTLLAGTVVLAVRAYGLAVVVASDEVIIRSWLIMRRIPRQAISGVGAGEYAGFWSRGGHVRWVQELRLTQQDGSIVVVSPIVGLKRRQGGTVERAAKKLASEFGLPDPPSQCTH